MIYHSAKGKTLPIVMLLILVGFIPIMIKQVGVSVMILLIVEGFLLWMWFDTYYVIKEDKLFYKSAIIKGSIPINAIHEIVKHKGLYSGSLKPALSMKGLVIKYNRWDDMYISPQNADEFIAALQKINPDIKLN